jgi:hypothetical protein
MEEKRIKEGGRTVNTLVFARTCSFWKSLRERFRCKNLRENAFARLRSVKVVPSLWERGSLICPQNSSDAPPFFFQRRPTFSSTSPSHPKATGHSQWFDLLEVPAWMVSDSTTAPWGKSQRDSTLVTILLQTRVLFNARCQGKTDLQCIKYGSDTLQQDDADFYPPIHHLRPTAPYCLKLVVFPASSSIRHSQENLRVCRSI